AGRHVNQPSPAITDFTAFTAFEESCYCPYCPLQSIPFSPFSLGPLSGRECIPNVNRVITRTGNELGAIGAECDAMDVGRMAAQLRHFLERGQVPEPDGVVGRAGRQARAVGAE